jgi:hypothetical protein
VAALWRNSGDLPHPEGSARRPQPKVERAIGKRLARISRKHKLRGREVNPAGSQDPAAFKTLLGALPLEERRTQAPWDGHILEDAPFAFDPESDDFLPHPLAIAPRELDQFLKTAGGLKEGIGQMEREGRPVALLPDFEVVEQPTDVGEEEVADLGLLVERRLDLGKRILEVPVLVGKGKRRPNLLEARGVLPLAQETVGFQGDRKRKTPRIQTCSSRPGQKPCPDALIGRPAVPRKVSSPCRFKQIGRKPLNVASKRLAFFISHEHGGILQSQSSFAITALIVHLLLGVLERSLRVPKNTLTGGPQPLESLEPIEGRLEVGRFSTQAQQSWL